MFVHIKDIIQTAYHNAPWEAIAKVMQNVGMAHVIAPLAGDIQIVMVERVMRNLVLVEYQARVIRIKSAIVHTGETFQIVEIVNVIHRQIHYSMTVGSIRHVTLMVDVIVHMVVNIQNVLKRHAKMHVRVKGAMKRVCAEKLKKIAV